jgi:hypothetical protein
MFYLLYTRYITSYSGIIPLIVALISYKVLSKPHKIILSFIVFSIVLNSVNLVLAIKSIHNLFMFHIYVGFEFAFVSSYFYTVLKGPITKIIPPLIIAFVVLCLVNFFYIQKATQLSTYTRAVESVMIVSYCIIFINRQSEKETSYTWGSLSLNWINTGILIFYSCSFITFMFTNYFLHAERSVTRIIWSTYDTFILIENILFAIAFYKCRKQPITLSH